MVMAQDGSFGLLEGEELVGSDMWCDYIVLVALRQEWLWRVRSAFWSTGEEVVGSDIGTGWILLGTERQAWFWRVRTSLWFTLLPSGMRSSRAGIFWVLSAGRARGTVCKTTQIGVPLLSETQN